MKHITSMSHILHVFMTDCHGMEASRDLGFFLSHQVEEAIACAKSHLDSSEATVIRMVPLGTYNHSEVRVMWAHDPTECKCTVCVNGRGDSLFTHDCNECEFMGCTMDEHGRPCDLYVHQANDEYIARYSSRDSDYIAHDKAIASQFPDRPTHVALKRWTERQEARQRWEAEEAAQQAAQAN